MTNQKVLFVILFFEILHYLVVNGKESYIAFEYKYGIFGDYSIDTIINNDIIPLSINLDSPVSMFVTFNTRKTQFYVKDDSFIINSYNYTEELNHGPIIIGNMTTNLSYYRLHSSLEHYDSSKSISFSLKPKDETFSLVHQLYNNKEINYKKVCISTPAKDRHGTIYFGSYPKKRFDNKNISNCETRNNKWECSLNKVSFTDKNHKEYIFKKSKQSVQFNFTPGGIYVSENILNLIEDIYFKEYLIKKDCFKENSSLLYYLCKNYNLIEGFPDFLVLQIGDYQYSIPKKALFKTNVLEDLHLYVTFEIFVNRNLKDNEWILGTIFLKHFDVELDYEKKEISFYYNKTDNYIIVNKALSQLYDQYRMVNITIIDLSIGLFCVGISILIQKYWNRLNSNK